MADAPTNPADPAYWPEAPDDAHFHDQDDFSDFLLGYRGRGWWVDHVPPAFPFLPPARPRELYGPDGTRWVFTEAQLFASFVGLPATPTVAALNVALQKFGYVIGGGTLLGYTTTAADPAPPEGEPMAISWIRTTIVGEVGSEEQVAHGINWRHESIENSVPTPEVIKGLGDAVRDKFFLYFDGQKGQFSPELRYTEVRSSFITLAAPGRWVEHGAGATQIEHPGAKPQWPMPTQVSPFGANVRGTGAQSLPYEVALALSFNTNFRGTSRFKGRLYLGPLSVGVLGGAGQFDRDAANILAGNFGSGVFDGVIAATDYKPHVISEKYCTSAEIVGVRVGITPDSQRRRRRSIAENYVQRWGVPVGGA